MLRIFDLKKDYQVADETVHALKGITVNFRRSEFVSILGPSGCGKTTLLNIIGGLDKYTSGNLVISGKSTRSYNDGDWDTYRNHSIGFIFQSYHLIPHQSILQNVELALTIAGVSKKERKERALAALEKVGLKDKIKNKPNQLSGGQAQRVAIARALINDPEIVLADEPTGALDSVTSVQIMELLKEISKDKLVIMVTHNPELAELYSTRIVRLLDGEIVDDTAPYSEMEERRERVKKRPVPAKTEAAPESKAEIKAKHKAAKAAEKEQRRAAASANGVNKGKKQHASMSFGMAFGLSLKNLLSKRKRTAMVSVAGSIGIIGVSMVLAISNGVQSYINTMENDMLSGYPVSITQSAYDFNSLMELSTSATSTDVDLTKLASEKKLYVNSLLSTLGTMATGFEKTNNISEAYIDYISSQLSEEDINLIQYGYDFNIANNLYTDFTVSDNLAGHLAGNDATGYTNNYDMSVTAIRSMYTKILSHVEEYKSWSSMISSVSTFSEMPDNYDYVMSQYEVVCIDRNGEVVTEDFTEDELKSIFSDKASMIMVISSDYKVDDLTLAQYGYFTEDEFLDYAYSGINGDDYNGAALVGKDGLAYSKFVGKDAKKFTYYPNDCVYTKSSYIPDPDWSDEAIVSMLGSELGGAIVQARNESGDDGLRSLYENQPLIKQTIEAMYKQYGQTTEVTVDDFVETFHLPTEADRITGFAASAYSTGYTYNNGTFSDTSDDVSYKAFSGKSGYDKSVGLGVKMILHKKDSVSYGCLESGFYYTKALTDYILETEKESEIVTYINSLESKSIESVPLYFDYYYVDSDGEETDSGEDIYILAHASGGIESKSGSVMSELIGSMTGASSSSGYGAGVFGGDSLPTSVYIYAVDFEAKNRITEKLDTWNDWCNQEGGYEYTYSDATKGTVTIDEKYQITYTDTVGLIINMVNTMIQIVTIALISFTALSLVVSTVMIGIITYVSVVERIKEIGILRAVGARKKDIKRLFNAETFIIGFMAGLFGILITYLLSLIVNIIVNSFAGFWGIAALPVWQAAIMVTLSVCLTLISGLIPASAAAEKDPVVALRTE